MSNDGAQIRQTQDPRFTALITWALPTIGIVAVGILGWIGNRVADQLSDLNTTVTRAVVQVENQGGQIQEMKSDIAAQRADLSALNAKVSSIEGKALRSIEQIGKEMARGN